MFDRQFEVDRGGASVEAAVRWTAVRHRLDNIVKEDVERGGEELVA
jgi:hypothetical protein